MAKPRKGTAKKNRACGVCKPDRAKGNGGAKFDRRAGTTANVKKYRIVWTEYA